MNEWINPSPPLFARFIGDKEAEPAKEQSNENEVDNAKTWSARSVLRVRGSKENHALPVKCLAFHPSISEPEITELELDVQCTYMPLKIALLYIFAPLTYSKAFGTCPARNFESAPWRNADTHLVVNIHKTGTLFGNGPSGPFDAGKFFIRDTFYYMPPLREKEGTLWGSFRGFRKFLSSSLHWEKNNTFELWTVFESINLIVLWI